MSLPYDQPRAIAAQKIAMGLSLGVGGLMLFGKMTAYAITGSAAILSDAAESVVHVLAVAFAAWSLWLSLRPTDTSHPYGYEKINYFSAGFEGGMIVLAALYILYEAARALIEGPTPRNLDQGTLIVAGAALINGGLGFYLVWLGRRHHSLILVADGRHILTDCYTSIGVVIGLILTLVTGWLPFDPLIAIAVALNILWTGYRLMRESFSGLMDRVDPAMAELVEKLLIAETGRHEISFHSLRHRAAGHTVWIEVHLLFPGGMMLERAHAIATEIEETLACVLPVRTEVITHLEPKPGHDAAHHQEHPGLAKPQ